jgi:hypothetical protein
MRNYRLTCLICGEKSNDLVRIQEHAMNVHGYTHQMVIRRAINGYIWMMPDGSDWLLAETEGEAATQDQNDLEFYIVQNAERIPVRTADGRNVYLSQLPVTDALPYVFSWLRKGRVLGGPKRSSGGSA